MDAIRQPERFHDFLLACECDIRGRTGFEIKAFVEADFLIRLLEVASLVDAGEIAKLCNTPEQIKQAVYEARLNAIEQALSS
jgi:tRNA nucleotidyltransferase (CCA-adding enzyme)